MKSILLVILAPCLAFAQWGGGGAASLADSTRAAFKADTCAVAGTTYTVYDSTKVDSAVYAETLLTVPDSAAYASRSDSAGVVAADFVPDSAAVSAYAGSTLAAQRSDTATYALNASAGGGSGFAVDISAGQFEYRPLAQTGPFLSRSNGTNQSMFYHPYDGAANETLAFRYTVPLDKSASDYLKSTLKGFAVTAAANDTAVFALMMCFRADGESWDNAVTFRDTLSYMAISATQNEIITVYDSTTLTNAGAVAGDECLGWLVRVPGVARDDHAGDFAIFRLKIE